MPTPLAPGHPVRWAILGAGRIAATVGADIQASPDSEVVAVGARSGPRAAELAARLGAARSYGSYADLVADPDVDVVYVATTHAQHHEHARLALRAGRPVLVEKAFTLTAGQARDVLAEAQARDLFCMEAMWMRMHPLLHRARDLIAEGALGTVLSVTVDHGLHFEYDPHDRLFALDAGGGALLDLGVYSVTFAWLFLGRPDAVAATGHLSPTGSDATTALQWSYADDRFAHVSCTAESTTPGTGLVVGTSGWLRFGGQFYNPESLEVSSDGQLRRYHHDNGDHPYLAQIREVERCLRAGERESPLVPWADTVGILELMDDARRQLGVRYPADDDAAHDDAADARGAGGDVLH